MPTEVILPKVDMDMTHGTLAVWHVAEGDEVKQGQPLFDIETDKAAMEVESPATGRLHHVSAKAGDKVPVGAIIAWLYAEGEAVGAAPAPAPQAVPETAPEAAPAAKADRPAVPSVTGLQDVAAEGVRATPAARAAARAAGAALAEISGSGPRGRIQRGDVAAHLDSGNRGVSAPAASGWAPETGPLHVTHRKGEGVPVVLIHGFTADGQSWSALEKALGSSRPVIRIDLPGHGKSPLRRIESFAKLARMLVETFDEATRGFDRVHLIGHSLGGALATAIADIRGRRIAGLTLIAPAGLGPEIDAAALNGIVRASRSESLLPWLRRLTATPDAIGEDYARAAMKVRMDPALRACQADMSAALFPDGVQAFDLRAAMARLECPTTILWGRQDHIVPHRHALALDGDFGIYFLAGAGHIPHIECPERVAKIVARQLAGAEAPV